jgi:3-oxoacyl-(acyl-carrier-protein) synthase
MKQAIERAGLQPGDVDYVNAHGTGTPNNDASECAAMQRLFGEAVPPFSSTKGYTGHTTSASGAVEAVISLLALEHQFLPANLRWSHLMPEGLKPVTDEVPTRPIRNVLCNAFGFGGNDSSMLFSAL